MATPQGDGSIILNTKVDTSGIKKGMSSIATGAKKMATTAGKAFLAIGAAATLATVAIVKSSVDAFAEYEQLVGGVETLFKGSSKKLIEYANQAYKTAGLSANQYMATVTGFSASLLQSLGGDTEKAADIANQALIDMSDNANKMGTSMESIQYAYQGFAKQNYTMLDNLKLGYGGTKTEMERLLKDAQALTGVKYDITNLADVYTAIHVIQENLGIAGTTALEAEKTISGSAATMKAAWQNVLTAISGGGDLDRAINNLVDSISNYFENIVPVVERALSGIGRLIEKVAPMLVQTVAKSLIKAIPSLLSAVYEMIIGLAKGIYQGIIDLFNGTSREALTEQAENIEQSVENQNDLTAAVEETNEATKKTLAGFDEIQILSSQSSETTTEKPPELETPKIDTTPDTTDIKKEVSKTGSLFDEIKNKVSQVTGEIKEKFEPSITTIKESFVEIKDAGVDAFGRVADATDDLWEESVKPLATKIVDEFVPDIVNSATENLVPVFSDTLVVGIENFAETYEWGADKLSEINSDIVEPAMEVFTTVVTDALDSVGNTWNEYGTGITEELSLVDDNARTIADSVYEKMTKPIFKSWIDSAKELWDEHIKPLWDELTLFFGSISEFALTLWNNVLSPVVNWIVEIVAPFVVNAINHIKDVFSTVISIISDLISGLIRSIRGIIDFLTGVFQGDWEQAWNGIKDFVGGIWDTIWGVIKGVINLIIDGLNGLWRGVYSVFSGIANGIGSAVGWVGELFGKDWGFSLPAEPPLIPKLARGAVIPPNREFLAVLGDNKRENEIVSPVSTMKQAFMEAMIEMGGNFGGGGNTEVILEIDGREFGRAVVEQGNRENRRIGTRLVIA